MRLLLLVPCLTLFSSGLAVQHPEAPQVPNVYKASPSDVATPDAIIHALYDVISGPAGRRNWDRMQNLFDPKAIMSAIFKDRNGELHHITFTPLKYQQMDAPYFEQNSFFEHEVKQKIEKYGQIAEVFSTYESRHERDDPKPFETGINSFLLCQDNGRWWIVSILWQGDDTGVPVPRKYL